jgi:hypothetical protein
MENKMAKRKLKIYVRKMRKFQDDPKYDMNVFVSGIRFWIKMSSTFFINLDAELGHGYNDDLPAKFTKYDSDSDIDRDPSRYDNIGSIFDWYLPPEEIFIIESEARNLK